MVFDYMDHDLTGLMDRLNHNLPVREVTPARSHIPPDTADKDVWCPCGQDELCKVEQPDLGM